MRQLLFLLFMVYSGLTAVAGPAIYPHSKDPHKSFLFQQQHSKSQVSVFDYDVMEESEDENSESDDMILPSPIYADVYTYVAPARAPGNVWGIHTPILASIPYFILYRNIRV
ncbi:MAG: hypothetical protein ACR2IL_01695 [Chitinophagaceae bacterium]